ncbi:dTDP-4-dehydrorhamnose 3,5-epimerase [Candidatus Methylopumilus planktonicus]|uniref:dTDP-4-dehydrorhamnose 3,5-epimerase n=1 Tax=Candidatus Methylopumilus planktonicus TaxID=1581557 RepID=A0A0D6EX33_9PROT|nr:dTDP-4-dehydrorhamnose 3,5-epimerase [Candidatus Methylopumilus planktonicus]CEZ19803.1 dTDP-4-dehydrorhamnose 3,5-epimerase [Candidatus Methylopumilus planktonicus]
MSKKVNYNDSVLKDVMIIKPETFYDHRGEYVEIFNNETYNLKNLNLNFVQDDISISSKNVLRGIHGDNKTWKLISCLYGSFYFVVVNNNPKSEQYKKWQSFLLSDKNRLQILVPPNFGNGHLVISDTAIFHYKQTSYYDPSSQFTIKWNDPEFSIWWPIKDPILSRRDDLGQFVD